MSYLSHYCYLSYFYRILSLFYYFTFLGGFKDHLLSPNFSPTVAQGIGPVSNNGSPTKAGPILEPNHHDSLFPFSSFGPPEASPICMASFFTSHALVRPAPVCPKSMQPYALPFRATSCSIHAMFSVALSWNW